MKIRKVKNAVGLVGNIVADMNATGVNDVPNTSTIKRYVDSKTIGEGSTVVYTDTAPVGTIRLFGREDLPEGWLPCNGAAYLKTEYASLYEAINVTFNRIDDDPRYFRVPDLSGNVPVGYGGDGEFSLGNTGGEKEHTLTIDEMPSHKHGAALNSPTTTNFSGSNVWGVAYSQGSFNKAYIDETGGSQAHNNMQPYVVVKYAIKAVDTTPTHGTIIDSMIGESTINAPSVNAVKNYVNKNIITAYLTAPTISTTDGFIKCQLDGSTSLGSKLTLENGSVRIGKGVSKIKVNGNVTYRYDSGAIDVTGAYIKKNEETIAQSATYKPDNTKATTASCSPVIVDVVEGDIISLYGYGKSSISTRMVGDQTTRVTYLTVEVVEYTETAN